MLLNRISSFVLFLDDFFLEIPSNFQKVELIIQTSEGNRQWIPLDFSSVSLIDLGNWKIEIDTPTKTSICFFIQNK